MPPDSCSPVMTASTRTSWATSSAEANGAAPSRPGPEAATTSTRCPAARSAAAPASANRTGRGIMPGGTDHVGRSVSRCPAIASPRAIGAARARPRKPPGSLLVPAGSTPAGTWATTRSPATSERPAGRSAAATTTPRVAGAGGCRAIPRAAMDAAAAAPARRRRWRRTRRVAPGRGELRFDLPMRPTPVIATAPFAGGYWPPAGGPYAGSWTSTSACPQAAICRLLRSDGATNADATAAPSHGDTISTQRA